MSSMFFEAQKFNGDISQWNVANVEDMSNVFFQADAFNGNIVKWNIHDVTDMTNMFHEASTFAQDLEAWGDKLNSNVITELIFHQSGLQDKEQSWYQ